MKQAATKANVDAVELSDKAVENSGLFKGVSDHAQMMLSAINNAAPVVKVTGTLLLTRAHTAYDKSDKHHEQKIELSADELEAMAIALLNVAGRLEDCECPTIEEVAAAVAFKH